MKSSKSQKNKNDKQTKKAGKKMQVQQPQGIENVTLTEILGLASWERERSDEELRSFVERRHAALNDIDLDVTI